MLNGDKIVRISSIFLVGLLTICGFPLLVYKHGLSRDTLLMTAASIVIMIVLGCLKCETEKQIRLFYCFEVFSLSLMSFYVSIVSGRGMLFVLFGFIIWLLNIPGMRKCVFTVLTILYCIFITVFFVFYKIVDLSEFVFSIIAFLMVCWMSYIYADRMNKMDQMIIDQNQSYDDMINLIESRFIEEKGANSAKSAFLANMSHEIRTPINAILGLNTMTLRESKEENIREYANDIEAAGQTLLSLINDILDLSKVESGKMEIVGAEYSLSGLINDVTNMLSFKAKDKNLELKVNVDPKLPSKLYGDDVRIRQVLINIMNNAVKYTDKGTVTLDVTGKYAGELTVLRFAVTDTGAGIKNEDMGKLFGKYERIDLNKNRNVEGTGLGMSIVIKILELMNSKLEVESEYGKGSTFSFSITQKIIDKTEVGNIKIGEKSGDSSENKEKNFTFVAPDARVLVVDDNKMNRMVFTRLLKRTKMQITEADSGDACLELVKKEKYDVIFLDHMMPGKDGIETLDIMRAYGDYVNSSTPVIALTANAISGSKEFYLNAGFDDYLSKPVNPAALEKLVADLLPDDMKVIGTD